MDIKLNNAKDVLSAIKNDESEVHLRPLEICQVVADTTISDENIRNNAKFLINMWD